MGFQIQVEHLLVPMSYRIWGERFEHLRRNASAALGVRLLVVCSLAALLLSGIIQYGTRLINWNPKFPLQIGNECTEDRPWLGRVLRVEFSDISTPEKLLHDFAGRQLVSPERRQNS